MEYMFVKRATSKTSHIEAEQVIRHFYFSQNISQDQFLKSKLTSPQLSSMFSNLHLYLSHNSLVHLKRFEIIADGIYILLKGQVGFRINERNQQKDSMNRSKDHNLFRTPSTIILNNSWTVFQTAYKNCTILEQSYLLYITEQQAYQSGFFQNSALRKDLYDNRYLPVDQELSLDQEITNYTTDIRIHSHFVFKHFYFREMVSLNSLGIIHKGRARLKSKSRFSGEFGKYAILIPEFKYEVTTAEIQVLIVSKGQICNYNYSGQLTDIVSNTSPAHTPVVSIHKKRSLQRFHHSSISSPTRQQFICNKEQRENRRKQLVKISKDSQSFSIISSYLFHTNLKYVKNHNSTHNLKQKKQNRYKHPLILFKVNNSKPNVVMPSFQQPRNNQEQINIKYISAHKVSSQSENNPITLLKKVGLPLAEQKKFISKHHYKLNQTLRCKQSPPIMVQQQEESFRPYNNKN